MQQYSAQLDGAVTVPRICEFIWNLEAEHDLLAWRVRDVHVWPLLRMRLYLMATKQLGLFENPHPFLQKKAVPARVTLSRHLSAQRSSLLRLIGWRKKPYAVLRGPLRTNGADPYTEALCKELGARALVFDRNQGTYALPGNTIDVDGLRHIFRAMGGFRKAPGLSEADAERCDAIIQAFLKHLGVDIGNLKRLVVSVVQSFRVEREGFRRLLAWHRSETLFAINGYSQMSFLEGARQAGLRIIELQHGFISRFHLGYSWPGQASVPYMPDELWCFGRFWPDATPLPRNMGVRIIGAPYIQAYAGTQGSQRVANRVLFTSQGVIGPKLLAAALECARRRPEHEIVFRLHPSELLEDYETLLAEHGRVPANFSLSHKTPNIFELMATAAIQVGVFSTTLLEGMVLGTRTVIIDLPGVDYMTGVVARGDALLVRDGAELAEKLDQAPLASDPSYYYAEPVTCLLTT